MQTTVKTEAQRRLDAEMRKADRLLARLYKRRMGGKA
jgi:hypothetical protein